MARILIVGGGCRGLRLADELLHDGHAVRVVTRGEERRPQVEASGAECFVADPDRLQTLRPALEHVAVACWLLATAKGAPDAIAALHGSRLAQFLRSAIDTTVRGVLYEAGGRELPSELLDSGAQTVCDITQRNAIPACILRADPRDSPAWAAQARAAVRSLLDPVRRR